jgi:hypothetical protein
LAGLQLFHDLFRFQRVPGLRQRFSLQFSARL